MMKAYVDASLSKSVIGLGVIIEGPGKKSMEIGVPLRSGLNSTEAELYALFLSINTAMSTIEAHNGGRKQEITFYTDCEPAINALYGLTTLRSNAARTLVEKVTKKLFKAKENHFKTWSIEPIRSKDNPAHHVAKKARETWRDIWKPTKQV